jgi:CheY-like chemotaxis protein
MPASLHRAPVREVVGGSKKGTLAMRILIADDDSAARALLRLLVLHTYPTAVVTEAADGQAALISYAAEGADLIISDIQMPVMDGVALIAAVRAQAPALPILAVSGVPESAPGAHAAGATRFLLKTGLVAQLHRALADLMNAAPPC